MQYYGDELNRCCSSVDAIAEQSDVHMHPSSSPCQRHDTSLRLESIRGKGTDDKGIFEAFEKRPDAIMFISGLWSIGWILLLQHHAKFVDFATEWTKAKVVLAESHLLALGSPVGIM